LGGAGKYDFILGNAWNNDGPSSFISGTWYALNDYNSHLDTLFDILYIAIDPSNGKHVYMATWREGLTEFNDGFLSAVYNSTNSPLEKTYCYDSVDWYWRNIV